MNKVNNCVVTKEDIEAALEQFPKSASEDRPLDQILMSVGLCVDDVNFLLRLAHKVMSEPNQEMVNAALGRDTFGNMYKDIFKAMINAAIEELETR